MNGSGEITGIVTAGATLSGFLNTSGELTGEVVINSIPIATPYGGPYEVIPKAWDAQILATEGKLMSSDVTVFKVPYYETSNIHDGLTVFIAEDTNG